MDLYIATMVVAGTAFVAASAATWPTSGHRDDIAWYVVALFLALAELGTVHLQVRSSAHSFTVSEVAIVVALCAGAPSALVAAAVIGPGIVFLIRPGRSVRKFCFNLAQYGLSAALVVDVHYLIGPGPEWTSVRTWIAASAATLLATLVTAVLVAVAIGLAESKSPVAMLRSSLLPSVVVTISNTALALCLLCLVAPNPWALLLPVPLICLVAAGFRAFESLHARNTGLTFLHETMRGLSSEPDIELGLATLLRRTAEAFHADAGEILLAHDRGSGPVRQLLSTEVGSTDSSVDRVVFDALQREAVAHGGAAMLPRGRGLLGAHLDVLELKMAMVAELRTDERSLGLLIVGRRNASSGRYGPRDLQLLHSLADHAALTLHSERMEDAFRRLRAVHRTLHYQASHDALTDLANRRALIVELQTVTERSKGSFGLLYLDLDGFKPVNDRYGHAAGDAVLIEVGRRLSSLVRVDDLVSRLGGDEFAILVRDLDGADDLADLERRIEAAIAAPILIGEAHVSIGASIGAFMGHPGTAGADEVLSHADDAMYRRKQARTTR